MSLSVVVPTLDEAPRIASFLGALRAALGPDDEVIVVDGGSADGTLALARQAGATQVLSAKRGRATQMNAGAAVATGEWLWFLHADVTLTGGAVEGLRRAAERPGALWGHFRVRLDDPALVFRWIEIGINWRSGAYHTPSGDQGIFVRRDLFTEVGGYPPVPFLEDLLLVNLLRRRADPEPPAGWVVTSARRWRREGVLRTVLHMWAVRAAFRLGASPQRLARYYLGGLRSQSTGPGSTASPLPNS